MSGPTEFDVRDLQLKIEKAQNDLDIARAKLEVKRANLGQTHFRPDLTRTAFRVVHSEITSRSEEEGF